MSLDKYTLWEDIVKKTAKFVARDFPEVDWEDLFQDLMEHVLTNKALSNPDAVYVAKNLVKKCTKMAWEYRKQSLRVTSQYSYRLSEVRKILQTAFDHDKWHETIVPEDTTGISIKWTSTKTNDAQIEVVQDMTEERMIVNSDVRRAFAFLPLQYKQVIFTRYALGETPKSDTEKKRLYRAVERLTDILNFYPIFRYDHEGPGSRKVINNATANYYVQEQDGHS